MRTTIQLNDQLHQLAREYAVMHGKTFTAVLEEALREKLLKRDKKPNSKRISLKTVKGQGLQAGIDLDNNAGLLDLMDAR
ncbi:MAG: CopG family transcriptional regulator [Thiothrix sp.]|nr:MAG: CopG family transcriptional regulator [Thiothrix sp.]